MTWRIDRTAHAPTAGFTLVELLVVIAILGLALALIGIGVKPVSPATHARAAAQEISGALRSARSSALMDNRSVSVLFDMASPAYQWGTHARQPLPPDVKLSLFTGRDQVVSDSLGRIRFDPDGGSSGGRVTVGGGGNFWHVGVDWLSGRVSIARDQP
jgi:general secretion pathway protein H